MNSLLQGLLLGGATGSAWHAHARLRAQAGHFHRPPLRGLQGAVLQPLLPTRAQRLLQVHQGPRRNEEVTLDLCHLGAI